MKKQNYNRISILSLISLFISFFLMMSCSENDVFESETVSISDNITILSRSNTNILEAELPIVSVYASSIEGNNVALNTLDGDLGTRWSADGNGQYIRYDLGEVKMVSSVKIAWYKGDQRNAYFKIRAGTTTSNTENVYNGYSSGSSGTTLELETYTFEPVSARYIRIQGYGNSSNSWNSITELEIFTEIPNIDFNHWNVSIPWDEDNNGKPDTYYPSDLIGHQYNSTPILNSFMYDDYSDTSIVFKTYQGITTANSSYPRTELREQITPGNNYDNWILTTGGIMEAELKVESVSDNSSSNYDKHIVIVGQIHGIVTQSDVITYGLDSNHAPPLLTIKWIDGDIKVYKKSLVDETTTGADLYDDSSSTWSDISYNFGYVGNDKFTYEVVAEEGKISVTINNQTHIFEDISLDKWPFENYFKAGNYLATAEEDSYSVVKFYDLKISH